VRFEKARPFTSWVPVQGLAEMA